MNEQLLGIVIDLNKYILYSLYSYIKRKINQLIIFFLYLKYYTIIYFLFLIFLKHLI